MMCLAPSGSWAYANHHPLAMQLFISSPEVTAQPTIPSPSSPSATDRDSAQATTPDLLPEGQEAPTPVSSAHPELRSEPDWSPDQAMSHSTLLLQQGLKTLLALALVLALLWLIKACWLNNWAEKLRMGKQGRLILRDSLRLDDKHTLYFIGVDTDTEILLGVSSHHGMHTIWKKRLQLSRGTFAHKLADNQGSDDVA